MPDSLNFETFQSALADLCRQYERRGVSRFITRLEPSFRHVRSFANAISSAAQVESGASLIWGGMQLVIEVHMYWEILRLNSSGSANMSSADVASKTQLP